MNALNTRIKRMVDIGITGDEKSFVSLKSISILTRLTVLSFFILFFYMCITFYFGVYVNSLFCALSLPFFALVYYLIYKKKQVAAKFLFALLILCLIATFSLIFGKGIGSEYWITTIGGMSLLIFNKKENSFNMILISILLFGLIQAGQYLIDPLYPISPSSKSLVFYINILFIFGTNFIMSYVLRYSGEEFEKKLQFSNTLLARKNKDLTDSITYANRIQRAVLPTETLKNDWRKYVFVLFEPKEIVSGDFYWIYPLPDRFLFAVVDGSGHGVSGALVSIMAHTMLTQCAEEYELREVDDIIVRMKMLISERKEKWNDDLADHMEITLCSYEWKTSRLTYSSNGNALYLIKHVNNVLPNDDVVIESDDRYVMKEIRNPHTFVQKNLSEMDFLSGSHTFGKDDMLYLATNGMSSQSGGPKGKKLKSKRLKDLLMSVQHLSLQKQRYIINDVALNWRGKFERTDDITLMGFRV